MVPREGLFFQENPYGFCQRTSRSAKTRLGISKSYPLKILSLVMRTFLADFCAPGGPLAKAVGIFLEKQPLPGDHDPLGNFKKLSL